MLFQRLKEFLTNGGTCVLSGDSILNGQRKWFCRLMRMAQPGQGWPKISIQYGDDADSTVEAALREIGAW